MRITQTMTLPKWPQRRPSEALGSYDRRLFLLGATVTAAGIVKPRTVYSVPAVVEPRQWTVRTYGMRTTICETGWGAGGQPYVFMATFAGTDYARLKGDWLKGAYEHVTWEDA